MEKQVYNSLEVIITSSEGYIEADDKSQNFIKDYVRDKSNY